MVEVHWIRCALLSGLILCDTSLSLSHRYESLMYAPALNVLDAAWGSRFVPPNLITFTLLKLDAI